MQRTLSLTEMIRGQDIGSKSQLIRNKLIKKIVILAIVLIASALFCVWSRVQIVQLGYEVSNLERQNTELTKQENHLRLEVERLKSPGRLQKVAGSILRMRAPKDKDIVLVKKQ